LDALPARGQPPDGAYRPRPEINPEQGRWLQKNGEKGLAQGKGPSAESLKQARLGISD
jgi:hypothetical protein